MINFQQTNLPICDVLNELQNSLAQNTPSAANIKGYADIVRDRSILRRLIEVSDSIVNSAFVPEGRTVRTLLDEAESRILQIGEEGSRKADYLEIEPLLRSVVARIDELIGGCN